LVTFSASAATILAALSTDVVRTAEADAPTTELVTGVVGDRCANCQAPLAADQQYCVNCGERRGRARFSPETYAVSVERTATEPPLPPRQPRFSSAATLVAGVATLLIALGVGVLIGHYSTNGTPARAQAPQVITLGAGAANTTSSTPTSTTASSSTSHGKAKSTKPTVVHVTAKTAKAANSAASKVLGSSGSLSHNVQQPVGGSCTGGAGCQNGKFTGNFFSGN